MPAQVGLGTGQLHTLAAVEVEPTTPSGAIADAGKVLATAIPAGTASEGPAVLGVPHVAVYAPFVPAGAAKLPTGQGAMPQVTLPSETCTGVIKAWRVVLKEEQGAVARRLVAVAEITDRVVGRAMPAATVDVLEKERATVPTLRIEVLGGVAATPASATFAVAVLPHGEGATVLVGATRRMEVMLPKQLNDP